MGEDMRNQKMLVLAVVSALAFAIAVGGCHTMHFDHSGEGVSQAEQSEWHHAGIYELVELSMPVDLKSRCEGRSAKSHTVERSFLNALVAALTEGIYSGWTVKIDCP